MLCELSLLCTYIRVPRHIDIGEHYIKKPLTCPIETKGPMGFLLSVDSHKQNRESVLKSEVQIALKGKS